MSSSRGKSRKPKSVPKKAKKLEYLEWVTLQQVHFYAAPDSKDYIEGFGICLPSDMERSLAGNILQDNMNLYIKRNKLWDYKDSACKQVGSCLMAYDKVKEKYCYTTNYVSVLLPRINDLSPQDAARKIKDFSALMQCDDIVNKMKAWNIKVNFSVAPIKVCQALRVDRRIVNNNNFAELKSINNNNNSGNNNSRNNNSGNNNRSNNNNSNNNNSNNNNSNNNNSNNNSSNSNHSGNNNSSNNNSSNNNSSNNNSSNSNSNSNSSNNNSNHSSGQSNDPLLSNVVEFKPPSLTPPPFHSTSALVIASLPPCSSSSSTLALAPSCSTASPPLFFTKKLLTFNRETNQYDPVDQPPAQINKKV